MKHVRKCPICNRAATKRLGKLDFCDDHHKEMKKAHGTAHRKSVAVWAEEYVFQLAPDIRIYRDYLIKIH